jgi:hypothetical protein
MSDFKSTGQNLTGGSGTMNQDKYDGCPRPYNPEMQMENTEADTNPHIHTSGFGSQHGNGAAAGTAGVAAGAAGHHGSHNTAGPHSSDMANKADPRIDSDRDGRGIGAGAAGVGAGATAAGTHRSHDTAGPHGSDNANKLDPRVDSDRSGTHRTGESLSGEHLGGTGAPGSHSAAFGLTPKDGRAADTSRSGEAGHLEAAPTGHHTDRHSTGAGHTGGTDSTPVPGHKKPSLMDRLNPMKDSDGDGQKGFMK